MALEALDDAAMPLHLARPAAPAGIGSQRLDVGQLGAEGGEELGGREEVVAGFAHVVERSLEEARNAPR